MTGGFARSVVNFAAGARTPLAGVIAALLMAVVLLGLTGLFERLPLAVLAATIIVAVVGLIDVGDAAPCLALRQGRCAWPGSSTAAGVLALGVEAGVGLGVAHVDRHLPLACQPAAHGGGRPRRRQRALPERAALLGHDLSRLAAAARRREPVLRQHRARSSSASRKRSTRRDDIRHLVLDLSSVSHVDLTAVEALQRLHGDLRERGIELHLAEVRGPVMDRLKHSELLQRTCPRAVPQPARSDPTLAPAAAGDAAAASRRHPPPPGARHDLSTADRTRLQHLHLRARLSRHRRRRS